MNMSGIFDGADNLSSENKCAIQSSFSTNSNWPYNFECNQTFQIQVQSYRTFFE